ncbi:MAG: hypothetical protein QF463_10920 [Vicinamibacterales bacterium]|nr:hypothetical protein [Vicinamibacterales bacterium]MDP6609566.1 hypothetical protein [Vicinamibacterales bacterium]HAK55488.1 hypothetical protein [Acidobacteriota bacterium]
MEWALHIRMVDEIEHLDLPAVERSSPSSGSTDAVQRATRAVVDELFGPIQVTRVYLGNEFCERLIPSAQLLERAHTAAAERGLALTLLTPYVTDDGIDRLRPLLSRLEGLAGLAPFAPVAGRGDGAEVVVNDWGVLRLLRREFPTLTPVLGRLLHKTLRDPLATAYYDGHPQLPPPAHAALRQSNLTVPAYRTFLDRFGIRMVEMDDVGFGHAEGQARDVDLEPLPVAAGLHMPYGFVATGRVCLFASLGRPKAEKFIAARECALECQRHFAEFAANGHPDAAPVPGGPVRMFHRGNTVFYSRAADRLRTTLADAESRGVERVIYQPQLPI